MTGTGKDKHPCPMCEYNLRRFAAEHARSMAILGILKAAYLKHVRDDPEVGWDDLDNMLMHAICNVIGDDEFCRWLEEEGERTDGSGGTDRNKRKGLITCEECGWKGSSSEATLSDGTAICPRCAGEDLSRVKPGRASPHRKRKRLEP